MTEDLHDDVLIGVGANLEAHDCHFGTPLHVACTREQLDCAKVLLNAGANVNAAKLHETALHHAAKAQNADLAEMLVQFGGNVYAQDNRGRKPSDCSRGGSSAAGRLAYYEDEDSGEEEEEEEEEEAAELSTSPVTELKPSLPSNAAEVERSARRGLEARALARPVSGPLSAPRGTFGRDESGGLPSPTPRRLRTLGNAPPVPRRTLTSLF